MRDPCPRDGGARGARSNNTGGLASVDGDTGETIVEFTLTDIETDCTRPSDIAEEPADELLRDMGPGEQATGKIVLDTAQQSGIVAYQSYLLDGLGWEWNY